MSEGNCSQTFSWVPSAQVRQAVIALLWIPDGTKLYLDAQHKNKFGGLLFTFLIHLLIDHVKT